MAHANRLTHPSRDGAGGFGQGGGGVLEPVSTLRIRGGGVSPESACNSLAAATGRDVLTVGPQEIVEMKTSQYPFTSDSEGSNRMDLADHGFMRDREHPPASWLGSQYFHRRRCDE